MDQGKALDALYCQQSALNFLVMLRIFFLYMLVTVVINLSFNHTTPPEVSFTFTSDDQLKEIKVAPLDTFQIQLPLQMGSGFQWTFSDSDHPEIRLLSQTLKDLKPLPGGTQYQVFTFQARQSGFIPLKLAFKRPWEDTVEKEFKMFFNISSPYVQKLP